MNFSLERLQPGPLPIFRQTHEALTRFGTRQDKISAREIANEILSDPFATLYLLSTTNQTYDYSPILMPVQTRNQEFRFRIIKS